MKNNVFFLDVTQNYGYSFSAGNTKMEFVAKGLILEGDSCVFHNGLNGTSIVTEKTVIEKKGIGKVITLKRKGSLLISWLFNIRSLYQDLKQSYCEECVNTVFLGNVDMHLFVTYCILSRLCGYRISCISHEWATSISTLHLFKRPFAWLYSHTFAYFADSVLPISEYIIQKISHFKKPYHKLPILGDFSKKTNLEIPKTNSVVYCVSADYYRVILPIIDAYSQYKNEVPNPFDLILVLGGTDNGVKVVSNYIKENQLLESIIIKRKIPYEELMNLYKSAQALLIPLDPQSEQDKARFSQKIAEYLSTGTPVISNNVGEIPFYFKDREDIVLCDYSQEGFVSAFTWISEHQNEAQKIGINGFKTGEREFNYIIEGKKLHDFLIKRNLI